MRIVIAIMAVAALMSVVPAQASEGTHSWLHATAGEGTGRVLIAPTAQESGEFYAQVELDLSSVPGLVAAHGVRFMAGPPE